MEKSLKAVLFTRRIEFRRTHNLADLASLLYQSGVNVPLADEQLLRLNPFAVIFRYDDIDMELLTPDEAAQWVAAMRAWAEIQLWAADEEVDGSNDK